MLRQFCQYVKEWMTLTTNRQPNLFDNKRTGTTCSPTSPCSSSPSLSLSLSVSIGSALLPGPLSNSSRLLQVCAWDNKLENMVVFIRDCEPWEPRPPWLCQASPRCPHLPPRPPPPPPHPHRTRPTQSGARDTRRGSPSYLPLPVLHPAKEVTN